LSVLGMVSDRSISSDRSVVYVYSPDLKMLPDYVFILFIIA